MRVKQQERDFDVFFHFGCVGHLKVKGGDYQEAMNRAHKELNEYNLDQTHMSIYTLNRKKHDVELDDCEIEYEEKENIESQLM